MVSARPPVFTERWEERSERDYGREHSQSWNTLVHLDKYYCQVLSPQKQCNMLSCSIVPVYSEAADEMDQNVGSFSALFFGPQNNGRV